MKYFFSLNDFRSIYRDWYWMTGLTRFCVLCRHGPVLKRSESGRCRNIRRLLPFKSPQIMLFFAPKIFFDTILQKHGSLLCFSVSSPRSGIGDIWMSAKFKYRLTDCNSIHCRQAKVNWVYRVQVWIFWIFEKLFLPRRSAILDKILDYLGRREGGLQLIYGYSPISTQTRR